VNANSLRAAALTAALLAGAVGCKREKKDPLLATPVSGVSSVNLGVRGIDQANAPDLVILLQAIADTGVRLTDFKLGNFSVLEDGKPVVPTAVSFTSRPNFTVGLSIDRSGSMGTTLTAAANTAAVAFVNALSASDRVGVVDFESSAYVVINPTLDHGAAISVIQAGAAIGATAFFDGVVQGIKMLASEPNVKFLIVLGDGDDNSSSNTLSSTLAYASGRPITVHTIILGTGVTDTSAFQQIANGTGGTFSTSTTGSDLTNIYLTILNSNLYKDLVSIKYRKRSSANSLTIYLNYGDITATANINVL
jgi:hypothetical protein